MMNCVHWQGFFRTYPWSIEQQQSSTKYLLFFGNIQNGVGIDTMNLLFPSESISSTCQQCHFTRENQQTRRQKQQDNDFDVHSIVAFCTFLLSIRFDVRIDCCLLLSIAFSYVHNNEQTHLANRKRHLQEIQMDTIQNRQHTVEWPAQTASVAAYDRHVSNDVHRRHMLSRCSTHM
jgi:hypothetical protein